MRLDLHGYYIHDGWKIFKDHLTECYINGCKSTVIVTGYGAMSREIKSWCDNNEYVTSCERLDPNQGAFRIKIKKRPINQQIVPSVGQLDLKALQEKYNK